MSDVPAEVTTRLADYLIARYGLERAAHLIEFTFGRTEFGDGKYGTPLLPWDGRNTTRDALDEATDLSQYLMKEIVEREGMADLFQMAAIALEPYAKPLAGECRDMAARLNEDCGRSVPFRTTKKDGGDMAGQFVKRIEPEEEQAARLQQVLDEMSVKE